MALKESDILNKKINNPETGRQIKVKSALGYDSNSAVHKKAESLLSKNNKPEDEIKKEPTQAIPEKARKKVVALLDNLKKMTDEAISKGESAPNYDLCKVSVPGTNLFCQVSLDIPRQDMPQLKGFATPGSPADKLPKDSKGEVDTEQLFKKALEKSGTKMFRKKIDASTLKATQSELVGSKVAGMTSALKKDPNNPGITAPIFVSKDGYILDGHHRWAAQVGLSLNEDQPVMMDVVEVDMDAKQLVNFTNKFCTSIGIKQKAGKVQESFKKTIFKNKNKQMKTVFKLSDALKKIKEIEEKTGKKFLVEGVDFAPAKLKEGEDSFDAKKMSLTEEECFDAKKLTEGESDFDAKKMSLTEETTTADIAVPETPINMQKMKPAKKMNNDVDYLTEDIPSTKGGADTEGFQKVKSLCSQLKFHIEKSSVETTQGPKASFAITFPKKMALPFNFLFKLNKLGYMVVVDSMAKVKVHIIEKPVAK